MALRQLASNSLIQKVLPETIKLHRPCQYISTLMSWSNKPLPYVYSCDKQSFKLQQKCDFYATHKCFAGHSKWANIKHAKGAQDKLKGQKASALSKQIQIVLARNPETNPKLNVDLANLIKSARTNNVPNDVIERAIDRVSKLQDPNSLTVFDGRGMSNTAILIECNSVNPLHTKQILQGVVKKYGFSLNSSAMDLFDHKGIIEVDLPKGERAVAQCNPDNFSLDKYVDLAIESGAEDVTLETDAENPYLQFTCGPQDLDKVQASLNDMGLAISSAERVYIPNLVVPVSKEYLDTVGKLTEKLDLHMDVVKYHFNLELEGSS